MSVDGYAIIVDAHDYATDLVPTNNTMNVQVQMATALASALTLDGICPLGVGDASADGTEDLPGRSEESMKRT